MTQHELWTAYRRQVRVAALTLWARTSKAARRSTGTDELILAGEWALWQMAGSYDPGRAPTLWAYARQRVVGEMIDWLRQAAPGSRKNPRSVTRFSEARVWFSQHEEGTIGQLEEALTVSASPSRALEGRDEVARQLRQLRDKERAVMHLYHIDGLTMRQVAARVGLSESRVSQVLSNALNQLREIAGLPPLAVKDRPTTKRGRCLMPVGAAPS